MTGLAALVEDRVTLLRSAIVLALTFQVCSAAAVFAVVKRLVDADWGWVAAACWLINPLAFLIAVQATEASVYGVSALGLLLVHLRVVEARMAGRQPSWRLVAAYGLALGVLCLARMDGAIVVALAIAWLAWPAISRPGDRLRAGASAFAVAAVAVLVVSPWWIFSASLLLWLAALILTYGLAVVERQIWWLTVPCLTIMLIEFMTVPWALGTVSGGVRIGRALQPTLVILAVLLLARWPIKDRPLYPWQPDVRRSQLAIRRWCRRRNGSAPSMPASPRPSGSGRVVALDGLVNHLVRTHWAERRFDQFVASNGIHYIADEARVLDKAHRFSRTPLRLELVASFPLHGWPTAQRHLWRVIAP